MWKVRVVWIDTPQNKGVDGLTDVTFDSVEEAVAAVEGTNGWALERVTIPLFDGKSDKPVRWIGRAYAGRVEVSVEVC